MPRLDTVKVAAANPRGWKIINATDFDPDEHELFDAAAKDAGQSKPATDPNKGPEQQAAAAQTAGQSNADPQGKDPATDIEIPENWQDLDWPQLRSLAAKVTDKGVTTKEDAFEAIEAHLADEDGDD